MSKIFAEAKLDSTSGKWYYICQSDDREVFDKSHAVFNSQIEAEDAIVEMLKKLVKEDNSKS